ncbi:MAG: type II secretion system F family protein [Thermoplasmatota archaeon]
MKSSTYSQFCLRAFHGVLERKKQEKIEHTNLLLEQANISLTGKEYDAFTLMNAILGGIISACLSFLFYVLFSMPVPMLLLLILPLVIIGCILGIYQYYPKFVIKRRSNSIDRFLPYAVNFLSTMSETGISPGEMFRTLATTNIYGEIQHEAKKISREINFMGVDSISALEHAIEQTPSVKFKSFIQGLLGALQAGSSLEVYLSTMVHQYMEDDMLIRERNLEFLSLIAELFVMAVIAFPLFLVIIVSVMGFVGDVSANSFDVIFIFAFLVLPLLYYMFFILIKATSLEEVGKGKHEIGSTFREKCRYNKGSLMVFLFSFCMMCVCYVAVFLLNYIGYITVSFYQYIDLLFLSLLLLIGPYAFYTHSQIKKKLEIQDRLPDFLISISNSLASGMNVFDSIKMLSKRNYARLTDEIKKMNAELSWRLPIKQVFIQFADRMKNPLIVRSVLSINRGLEMGGNTPALFKAAAREIQQVNRVRQQRYSNMSMYAVVILMCFFVFLFIMFILNSTLFNYFFEIQLQQKGSQGFIKQIDASYLHYGLYSFVFVQAIGSGILAGYLMDGNVSGGMRLSFILGIISILVFKYFF